MKGLCLKGVHEKHLYDNISSLIKEGLIKAQTEEEEYKNLSVDKFPHNILNHE